MQSLALDWAQNSLIYRVEDLIYPRRYLSLLFFVAPWDYAGLEFLHVRASDLIILGFQWFFEISKASPIRTGVDHVKDLCFAWAILSRRLDSSTPVCGLGAWYYVLRKSHISEEGSLSLSDALNYRTLKFIKGSVELSVHSPSKMSNVDIIALRGLSCSYSISGLAGCVASLNSFFIWIEFMRVVVTWNWLASKNRFHHFDLRT